MDSETELFSPVGANVLQQNYVFLYYTQIHFIVYYIHIFVLIDGRSKSAKDPKRCSRE